MAQSIPEMYGSLVFNDKVMRSKLPKDMYKALKKTIENGTHLELDVANSVAVAMKEWAVENGATHFTHWFQPMTGFTAEKHDSFISPTADGEVIMEFSGKELLLLFSIYCIPSDFPRQFHKAMAAITRNEANRVTR